MTLLNEFMEKKYGSSCGAKVYSLTISDKTEFVIVEGNYERIDERQCSMDMFD
jgi:hypothetical protein